MKPPARLANGKLESCIFVESSPVLPNRDWLAGLFALDSLDAPLQNGAVLADARRFKAQGSTRVSSRQAESLRHGYCSIWSR